MQLAEWTKTVMWSHSLTFSKSRNKNNILYTNLFWDEKRLFLIKPRTHFYTFLRLTCVAVAAFFAPVFYCNIFSNKFISLLESVDMVTISQGWNNGSNKDIACMSFPSEVESIKICRKIPYHTKIFMPLSCSSNLRCYSF